MPLSLYLHIPFCTVRCSYCDFNTYAGLESLIESYARALADEVRQVAAARPDSADETVHTVFFGGGTPSLVPPESLAGVLRAIRESFDVVPDAEITMEANPGTVDAGSLAAFRDLGINRISFGVQSAQPSELKLLDRLHDFDQVVDAVRGARAAGFDNLNLDLIYGLPRQGLAGWQDTLVRTLALEPDHLSLYALTLEFGTPLAAWVGRGLLEAPDPDLAADMYEWAGAELGQAGFAQYEISNWARLQAEESGRELTPRMACRHNLQYWRNGPYLGFGAGAHGFAAGWRYSVVRSPRAYLARIDSGAVEPYPFSAALADRAAVQPAQEMSETMMMGMRLTSEGVDEESFRRRFGRGLHEAYPRELEELSGLGLIEQNPERVRLTSAARLVANRVFAAFV